MRALAVALPLLAVWLALAGSASADLVLEPSFVGSRCVCSMQIDVSTGQLVANIMGSCRSSAGYANYMNPCLCFGLAAASVQCPSDSVGTLPLLAVSGSSFGSGFVASNTTFACAGVSGSDGCTNGSSTTKYTTIDNFSTKLQTIEKTPCTNPTGTCTCILSAPVPGPCNATCGTGFQNLTSTILRQPKAPDTCPPLVQTVSCVLPACQADCVVTDWSPWSTCSASCGAGIETRTRQVAIPGPNCPSLVDTAPCQGATCPVNCSLSNWTDWSLCSVSCGGGTQTRTRSVITAPANGGLQCGNLQDSQPCNTQPCPVDCVVSAWSNFSTCSASCGSGLMSRTRSVLVPPSNGGAACPTLSDTATCSLGPCPVDCVLSDWGPFTNCSAVCGNGTQTRTRSVMQAPANGGAPCGPLFDTEPCAAEPCQCVLSPWSNFSLCSRECGGGSMTRTRTVITPGLTCDTLIDTQPCNLVQCPVDCVLGPWTNWTSCSSSCGTGTQTRSRSVITPESGGGQPCGDTNQIQECNTDPCPIDCQVGNFSAWSACSAPCNGGLQNRTRSVVVPPQFGGAACPALTEVMECNTQGCPTDCQLSAWSAWSSCSASCGGGTQTRTRTVSVPATNGGACNGELSQSQQCNTQSCPVDCVVSNFSNWTACSVSCGGGMQSRSRTVVTPSQFGGASCPPLVVYQECSTQACPQDCLVGDFSAWSPCSVSCGTGTQTRSRNVTSPATNGGNPCPPLVDSRECNLGDCVHPVDCAVSNWTDWSACGSDGTQTHTRTVITMPKAGGQACPPLSESRACNGTCSYGDWHPWEECRIDCQKRNGDGTTRRFRPLLSGPRDQCTDVMQTGPCTVTNPPSHPGRKWIFAKVASPRQDTICSNFDCSHCPKPDF